MERAREKGRRSGRASELATAHARPAAGPRTDRRRRPVAICFGFCPESGLPPRSGRCAIQEDCSVRPCGGTRSQGKILANLIAGSRLLRSTLQEAEREGELFLLELPSLLERNALNVAA